MNKPVMRKTTRDEKIVRPGVYEVSVEQEEQEPFDMDDHPPHRLCECRKCMEYFTPLPDCDAFAAFGKPMQEPVACGWEKPCDKLKATQESLREHMARIKELEALLEAHRSIANVFIKAEQDHFAASGKPIAEQERMPITEPVVPWLSHKVAEQAEQEPVAWYSVKGGFNTCGEGKPLYAAPVRTKDLTDDDLWDLWNTQKDIIGVMRAIIAADRRLNK